MLDCAACHQRFENRLELAEHYAMVHDEKWTGHAHMSQNGDEEADGAVSPKTSDYLATDGNTRRPSAAERARERQKGRWS